MAGIFGIRHWIRRPSLWICIAMTVVCVYALGLEGYGSRYVLTLVVQASDSLAFITPALTVAVAWEASRMRALRGLGAVAVVKILRTRCLPFLIFPVIGFFATAVLLGRPLGFAAAASSVIGLGEFSVSSLVMMLYIVWVGLYWIVLAAIAGLMLRPGLAIALSALLPYMWHGLVPAMGPGLMPAVAGNFLACCSLETVLDLSAVGSATLGIAGLVGVAGGTILLLTLTGKSKNIAAVCAVAGVLSIGGSAWVARGLPEYGVVPRSAQDMKCRNGICVRPEVPAEAVDANSAARDALSRVLPAEWSSGVVWSVAWNLNDSGSLSFVVSTRKEEVLGSFINQVAVDKLIDRGESICGVNTEYSLGRDDARRSVMTSQMPWPLDRPITADEAAERVRTALCKSRPSGGVGQ